MAGTRPNCLPADAFQLSYMLHTMAIMVPATVHTLSSWTHPGTAHAIIATTFGALAIFRTGLHFSWLKPGEAMRLWHTFIAIASVACPVATLATGRFVPVTEMDLAYVAFGYVSVNFTLIAFSNFPSFVLASFVGAHFVMIPAFEHDGASESQRGRRAALLLCALVFGVVAGFRLRTMFALSATPPSSARSSADRPAVLAAMCNELAAGTALLVDVREPRETAKGRLQGALL